MRPAETIPHFKAIFTHKTIFNFQLRTKQSEGWKWTNLVDESDQTLYDFPYEEASARNIDKNFVSGKWRPALITLRESTETLVHRVIKTFTVD